MTYPSFNPGDILFASDQNAVGLWKVASTTATSGTVINVEDCFSSTYDNYRIVISNYKTSAGAGIDFQLLNGSTPTTTGYYASGFYAIYANTPAITGFGRVNASSWPTAIVGDLNRAGGAYIDIFSPNKADETTYVHQGTDPRTNGGGGMYTGLQDSNTQFTGFRLNCGTISLCDVAVYGFRK
jgi:hypothetical protein